MRIRKVNPNFFVWVIFFISFYSFLIMNGVFDGEFDNDPIAWLLLAGGICASVSLHFLIRLVEAVIQFTQRS